MTATPTITGEKLTKAETVAVLAAVADAYGVPVDVLEAYSATDHRMPTKVDDPRVVVRNLEVSKEEETILVLVTGCAYAAEGVHLEHGPARAHVTEYGKVKGVNRYDGPTPDERTRWTEIDADAEVAPSVYLVGVGESAGRRTILPGGINASLSSLRLHLRTA